MATPTKPPPTLLPKPPTIAAEGSGQGPTIGSRDPGGRLPKRHIVNQACESCRKRKVKCDGIRPICAPCARGGLECRFVRSKADIELQHANYRSVVELFRERSQPEAVQILQRIQEANNLEETVNSIAEARLLLPPASTSNDASSIQNDAEQIPPDLEPSRPRKRRFESPHNGLNSMFEKQFITDVRDKYVDNDIFINVPEKNLPFSRWTEVSDDNRLMNHLLKMFWTWDNIVEKCLFRPMFEEDVAAFDPLVADDESGNFCSRFLVNALLALSCLYTMDSAVFKDPGDPATRGRRWADEAEIHLAKTNTDKPSIPLLQGLLALFCYEGNLGPGTKAVPYYFQAMDAYKALNTLDAPQQHTRGNKGRTERERQATSWCIWGFYCCEWRSSQAFGFRKLTRKPKLPKAWRESDFPISSSSCSSHWWYPYPMSLQVQKSMKVEIREVDAILSEIAEEALKFIYPDEGGTPPLANPQRVLELYRALFEWKQACPSRLRLEEAILPSAILLHISAEVMITAVLRPFTNLGKDQFGRFDPRERCYAHASSLASAIWTFRALAVIRFEHWLCHALGTAAYIVVGGLQDSPVQVDTLMRACQCLFEMRETLPLATDVLSGIYAALRRSGEPIPACVRKYFASLNHRRDGLMHYAIASLLPNATDLTTADSGEDVQLHKLLDGWESIEID